MRNKKFVCLVIAFCLIVGLSANLFAQHGKTQTQTKSNTSIKQQVVNSQIGLVSEFDVNGLKVLVKHRPNSLTVAAGLFIRGGVQNMTAKNAGIEGLMLDVMSESSTKFPREKLRAEISRMGATISSGSNYDYSALALACTRQSFDRSWEIFTDVALNPSFTPDDVKLIRERRVVSLRNVGDDPDSFLQQQQEKVAYANHPYLNDPSGTIETISSMSGEDLRAYHKQVMQTSQLLIVIVGDVDADSLKQKIAASFGKFQRGNYKSQMVQPLIFNNSTVEISSRQIETNYIQGMFTAPSLNNPDFYPMRAAMSILAERIFTEVRRKRNLSYAPDAFLRTQGANVGGLYVTTDYSNLAIRIMLDEIEKIKREPVEKLDLDSVTGYYLTTHYLGQETNAAQAATLAQYELIGGGWKNSFDFLDKLRAVTAEDIQRVAKKYMKNIRFVVVGDPASVDKAVFTSLSAG
jgi:predicted Zn-dependent peptidase